MCNHPSRATSSEHDVIHTKNSRGYVRFVPHHADKHITSDVRKSHTLVHPAVHVLKTTGPERAQHRSFGGIRERAQFQIQCDTQWTSCISSERVRVEGDSTGAVGCVHWRPIQHRGARVQIPEITNLRVVSRPTVIGCWPDVVSIHSVRGCAHLQHPILSILANARVLRIVRATECAGVKGAA